MSKTPTGEETPVGSNPAGVASPTTPEIAPSPARTELRSVPAPENPQFRRCGLLDPGQPGAVCGRRSGHTGNHIADMANVITYGPGWTRWWGEHGSGEGNSTDFAKLLAAAGDDPPADPEIYGPAPVQDAVLLPDPALRHCTGQIDGETGGELCNAVLGANLHCERCKGQRCYAHCRGVDHLGGKFVTGGHSGKLRWKLVRTWPAGYAGQVYRGDEIVGELHTGAEERDVLGKMLDQVDELRDLERRLRTPVPPGPEQPRQRVLPVARSGQIHVALDALLSRSVGRVPDGQRGRVLLAVVEWLNQCAIEWEQLGEVFDAKITDAKKLHDQQVVELFTRIGGAL